MHPVSWGSKEGACCTTWEFREGGLWLVRTSAKQFQKLKTIIFNLWKSEFLLKEINLMIVNGMISCLYMAHTRIIDIGYFLRWEEECLDFSSWKTSRIAKYTVTDKCIHILLFFLFFKYQVYCKTFRIIIMFGLDFLGMQIDVTN